MNTSVREAAIREFEAAKFGMFIHFGLYSLLGRGEWVQFTEKIPADEYANLMKLWNCRDFDADRIARMARDAGMKYITFTTRHHEGFSLFDTALSEFKSTNSAARRDLVREMTDACRKHGLKIFYYYSLPDWHREDYIHNFSGYREFVKGQLRELLTLYGKVDGVWFDSLMIYYLFSREELLGYSIEDWNIGEIYELVHELQPHILIGINRASANLDLRMPAGDDIDLAEYNIPDILLANRTRTIEICDTLTPGIWGWDTRATFLDTKAVIEKMLNGSGKGVNLLLNVGPENYGRIPDKVRQTFREVGLFARAYAEAIYNVEPATSRSGNFLVRNNDEQFGYLLRERAGIYEFDVQGLVVASVNLLSSGEQPQWSQDGDILKIGLNGAGSDPWFEIVRIGAERPGEDKTKAAPGSGPASGSESA